MRQEPVFLTKNGYDDMVVVMSMEAYEDKLFDSEIYEKLKMAELEAKSTKNRIFHEVVFSELRRRIAEIGGMKGL
jgi:PHD/YefM family antitoxin component YafN of YafNO toxin-antitoxin module